MPERRHEDKLVAFPGGDQGLSRLTQAVVIAEDPVELLVADLERDHADDRAFLEHRMRDEDGRLAQPRIDLVVGDLGLEEHPGPLEDLGQLRPLERAGQQVLAQVEVGLDAEQEPPVGAEEIQVGVSIGFQVIEGRGQEHLLPLRLVGLGERALGQPLRQLLGGLDGAGNLADDRDVPAALADEVVELGVLGRRDRQQLAADRALQRAHRQVVAEQGQHAARDQRDRQEPEHQPGRDAHPGQG